MPDRVAAAEMADGPGRNGAEAVEAVQSAVDATARGRKRRLAEVRGQDRQRNGLTVISLAREERERPGLFPGRAARIPHHKFAASLLAALRVEFAENPVAQQLQLRRMTEEVGL